MVKKAASKWPHALAISIIALCGTVAILGFIFLLPPSLRFVRSAVSEGVKNMPPPLNKRDYDARLLTLAHISTTSPWGAAFLLGTTTPIDSATGLATTTRERRPLWPARAAYPNAGALLPFNRIVAYYGNFYSTGMGVLGEYPPDEMLAKLASTTKEWEAADPKTPVIPAIHYIVVTAQASAGKDKMYRARMPDDQIDKALELAVRIRGIVFIDFQVGLSTIQKELPQYTKYLEMPNVHVGIDPEFSMKGTTPPGREIGTYNADDVNWVLQYLASIVRERNLPPKILVVHRFTQEMLTGAENIIPLPEVQVVIDMDGWGSPQRKTNTFTYIVAPEPVQFTGFKLFYKNDLKENPPRMMTPKEVLSLTPVPVYIQYQ